MFYFNGRIDWAKHSLAEGGDATLMDVKCYKIEQKKMKHDQIEVSLFFRNMAGKELFLSCASVSKQKNLYCLNWWNNGKQVSDSNT